MNALNVSDAGKPNFLGRVLLTLVVFILIAEGYCGWKVHDLSRQQEAARRDYSMVNSVSFGLLSVDVWRDEVIKAASAQIEQYRLTPSQKADLKKEIEEMLHGLVDHAFTVINRPQKSLGGKIKKMAIKAIVDQKQIHEEVPGFSAKIMAELTKSASYQRLANIADTALGQMGKGTYDSSMAVTKNTMDSIFRRYKASDKAGFDQLNARVTEQITRQTYFFAAGMLGAIVLLLGVWAIARHQQTIHVPLYMFSVVGGMFLLIVGVTTTMIEIDARIKSMNFHLLGQTVAFRNQELFFQSKSILDVVLLLLKSHRIDSQLVGIMILVFSILFPFAKLLSTGVALASEEKWGKNKYVQYFAFKSGKWSMADVMVVAILMTYIGFNGIVESTLGDLNLHNETITSITTNNTSIQPGYVIFIAFVVYGFVLSAILKKITHQFRQV